MTHPPRSAPTRARAPSVAALAAPAVAVAAAILALPWAPAPAAAQDVAFTDVRLFDGEAVREDVTVLVRDGVIAAVGPDVAVPDGVEVVDGAGRTLLPGLIDAHTHAQTRVQLETALAFGVTTELDHFGTPDFLRRMRAEQRDGEASDRADLFGAGIVATVPGGHGTQYGMEIPTLTTPEEAEAFVADRVAEGSDWLKVIRTDPAGRRPTLDLETIEALIDAAHAHGIMAVVHVSTVDDALAVAEMGADGIVHTAADRMPGPDFGARFAASGAFAVPTLTVLWGWSTGAEGAAQMEDPLLGPWLDAEQRASLEQTFSRPEDGGVGAAASAETVRLMDEAGVPLLAGSDAPNPNTAHGATLHRELENLVEAGLTPTEALVAATSAPADAFGLDDRGRVAPGLRADLLLVEGDPTTDVRATRWVLGVWKGGVRADLEARQRALAAEAERPTEPVRPDVPEDGVISDFGEGMDATFGVWTTSTDALTGGRSTASAEVASGVLTVRGEVVGAGMATWSGAFFSPAGERMTPVDLSAWSGVAFRVRAPEAGTFVLMTFGDAPMPGRLPFEAGPEWREVVVPFADVAGLDPAGVTGLFLGRSGVPGPYTLSLDDVRLVR